MKILWITNILMPEIAEAIGSKKSVGGGWMPSLASALKEQEGELQLAIATVSKCKEMIHQQVNGIDYYVLPLKGKMTVYQRHLEYFWKQVCDEFQPDVVHIHGTEYPHGLSFLNACPELKSVISIQGMVGPSSRYYASGLTPKDVYTHLTIKDLLTRTNVYQEKRNFKKRSVYEEKAIKKVSHIIGRTSWDKAHTWAINPRAEYHFCNETLRASFYKNVWEYACCEPHSIFVSQAGYPLKGLHQVLKAMPLVLRHYPDTKLYVSGSNILEGKVLLGKLHLRSNYGSYIKSLISKLKLKDTVFFLGQLQEDEMCKQFLKSNVFVCPSSIENSPNSLGEAQLMGIPCIASYVGGIPDMMKGFEDWCYRYEEIEMLAELICKAFEFRTPQNRQSALERHDPQKNCLQMMKIYKKIAY